MKHEPLKRHKSLQPLSRDHYAGLVQARRLRIAADHGASQRLAATAEFVGEWDALMAEHLADEEHLLLDLIENKALVHRLLDEHDQIRSMATTATHLVERVEAPVPDRLRKLASVLHDHIRWEERTLFPAIEQQATPAELEGLSRATEVIESMRPRWERTVGSARRSHRTS